MTVEARRIPRIVENTRVLAPRSPSYIKLEQKGEIVRLNDIRNEAPLLDGAIAHEINAGIVVGQGTLFEGIVVYKPFKGEDTYGLPQKGVNTNDRNT